jgi:Ca2+-binding RTX toxin-like protein
VALNGTFENVIGSRFKDNITGNAANNLLRGGEGDDKLVGGPGNDILLGEAGNDDLVGSDGRDILIGGTGADRIVASAGEDILIAGTTAHDSNDTALLAIQAEWTSARDYATRVANIRGTGTGPRLNGTFFFNATTVFDDFAADTLTGSQQKDWFWIFALDNVTDQNQDEFIN